MPVNEPPQRNNTVGRLHDVVESAMATTVLGGMLAPHYRAAVSAAYETALQDWYAQLVHAMGRVEERIGHVELEARLARMETAAALNVVTQSAGRTSDPAKRELLARAVEGVLLDVGLEAELRDLFLGLVDTHTVSHVLLLRILQNPTAAQLPSTGQGEYSVLDVIDVALPRLKATPGDAFEESLVNTLGMSLNRDGLCVWGLVRRTIPVIQDGGPRPSAGKLTTKLGDRYLHFLAEDSR